MLIAAADAIRLALWEREASWGQLGVPRSLCKLQIHDDATNCRGLRTPREKIEVGPAPYWTLPALVIPKIAGSSFARKTRPPATTPMHPDPGLNTVVWPVSAQPFLLRVTPTSGCSGQQGGPACPGRAPEGLESRGSVPGAVATRPPVTTIPATPRAGEPPALIPPNPGVGTALPLFPRQAPFHPGDQALRVLASLCWT